MNKLCIAITGSTRGIGRGLALEFLKRGHQVIINGRSPEAVKKVVREFEKQDYDVLGVAGDVGETHTFQSIIEKAQAKFGKIDIWINNAGIPQDHKYFHELDPVQIENLVSVNITSLMLGTQAAIKLFKQQGFGLLLNMEGFGSDGRMMKKLSLYGTSKRAVQYFTKSVSREVEEKQIRVGIISPGMVRTDFIAQSASEGDAAEQKRTQKVFDILAEEVEVVTEFLVKRILRSTKKYDRIEFLTFRRMAPKILKLMFVKT
jgi:NAD(P)-dependent dehydrogenase (short-subunit alcohol dehydrogenase family)